MSDSPSPADRIAAALERARRGPPRLRSLCADLGADDAARKPGVGKLSVMEHVTHMLGMERDVFAHRMHQTLDQESPRVQRVVGDYFAEADLVEARSLADSIDEYTRRRAANVALVEGTGPEQWERPWLHPDGRKRTLLDLVHEWANHDDEHLRQIQILARNAEERNL